MAVIFVGYFLWDVLTKAVVHDAQSGVPRGLLKKMSGPTFWDRGLSSLIMHDLGIVAWYFLRDVSIWTDVLCADVSLLSLVLLLRS